MANDYYDESLVDVPTGVTARSEHIDNVSLAVSAAFDQIPSSTEMKAVGAMIGVDSGLADAYIVNRTNTVTSLDNGLETWFLPINDNTAGSTLNIDTLGAKAIKRLDGSATQEGDLLTNKWIGVRYNSISDTHDIITPSAGTIAQLEALYDDFETRYLGAKPAAPTLNNAGEQLAEGVIYFNTLTNLSYVWDGVVWTALNQYTKYIADVPPEYPYDGQEWFDTATGIDYTYYFDEDLKGQWLQQPMFASGTNTITIELDTTLATASVTTTATIDLEDNINFIDATSGDITATLPTAVGNTGKNVHLKRVDTSTNKVVIDTTASQTIDSNETIELGTDQNILIISDGTNWRIL